MYQIEKNIPLPEGRQDRQSKYPLAKMVPGDSFLIPADEVDTTKKLQSVRNSIHSIATKKLGKTGIIRTRRTSKGLRVWLTDGEEQANA